MADFGSSYTTPMDQEYHSEMQNANARTDSLNKTIFPISLIGQTVMDLDPATHRGIVEGVEAAFRGGAGNIQLVMSSVGAGGGMGGGPTAYGEDVRRAVREIQKATGGKITGIELPNRILNVSGYDTQRHAFSEDQRRGHLDEVRDAIKFVGDIAGGGGISIISWEFPRNVSDAKWGTHESEALGKQEKDLFKPKEKEYASLVDSDSGQISSFDKKEKYFLYYDDKLNPLDEDKLRKQNRESEFKPRAFNWDQVQEIAKKENMTPEEFIYYKYKIERDEKQIEGNMAHMEMLKMDEERHLREVKHNLDSLEHFKRQGDTLESLNRQQQELQEQFAEARRTNDERKQQQIQAEAQQLAEKQQLFNGEEEFRKMKGIFERRAEEFKNSMMSLEQQKAVLELSKHKNKPVDNYGLSRTTDSYAEAGIWAMQETQKNQYVQHGKGEVHVGPEISRPEFYGSHPREWVEIIKKSREKMAERLTHKEIKDDMTGEILKDNPYYDPSLSEKQAQELAKKHIRGELDTGHIAQWLQTFKPELQWDKRVSEFKKWYKEQMEYLAEENKKYDLIGEIQIVDSATGQHAHLPPGQGVLGRDIVEYMKILKEKGGYKGELTSEGHEEERFGQGRMLTKAWEVFGSPIGSGYFAGRPLPVFSDIRSSYAQIAYGTTGIFQSYVPSNDFQLWSQVPLE